MKIHTVNLEDFRCFEHFEINFDPSYNTHVILAENMAGKSALIRALRIAVGYYISGLSSPRQKIDVSDHRVIGYNPIADISLGSSIQIKAEICTESGEKIMTSWRRYMDKPKGRTLTQLIDNSLDPSAIAKSIYKKVVQGSKKDLLPLFCFIGTEYLHIKPTETDELTLRGDATQGYRNCLEDKSIEKLLFSWLGRVDGIIGEKGRKKIVEEAYGNIPEAAMTIFQNAVKAMLPDVEAVEWLQDRKQPIFKFKNGDVRLFDMLSDGYRYLVLITGELSTRAFILNKHYPFDCLLRDIDGVVLIDEFGIHLHPSLQNNTLLRLQRLFPNVQFILSTHSPLLINGLKKEQIHLLDTDAYGNRIVGHPDDDAIGMGAEGLLRYFFGLDTTYDQTSLGWNDEYKILFSKKQKLGLSLSEKHRLAELSHKLAPLRLDPTLNIVPEEDRTVQLIKEKLSQRKEPKTVEEATMSAADISRRIDNALDEIFSTKS